MMDIQTTKKLENLAESILEKLESDSEAKAGFEEGYKIFCESLKDARYPQWAAEILAVDLSKSTATRQQAIVWLYRNRY